ncbi:hypothetical protein VTK56DRAFT_7904 [Thermocarpiscus australiensis]
MEERAITLTTKPRAALHISIRPPEPSEQNPLSDILVVFLNGLVLPCSSWSKSVDHLVELRKHAKEPIPALLCYDRYGQGNSDPDPTDAQDTPYGHDVRDAVADLHQLLTQVSQDEYLNRPLEELRLVLVCNSIGCALARLYAATHPGRVEAFLFLDSIVANTDFVSFFPDPDDPSFDPSQLPADVSADDLRHARTRFRDLFHPTQPNPEHLDRRNLAELLPHADQPALPAGPGGRPPVLFVIGHDWDEFAQQCENGSLSVPKAVINAYVNPAWGSYNEGLTRLVPAEGPERKGRLKIAVGCGHFIQKDDPVFVAAEISEILNVLQNRK